MIRASKLFIAGLLGIGGLLASADSAWAQRHGGHGHGRGHGGHSHGHGHGHGGHRHGHGGHGHHHGHHHHHGHGFSHSFGHSLGHALGQALGGYGHYRSYPSYYGSGYYPYSSYSSGYYYPSYDYSPSYYSPSYYDDSFYSAPYSNGSSSYGAAPSYAEARPAATAEEGSVARLRVILPDSEAQVWVDGRKTSSTGSRREFRTPPLRADQTSFYTLTAAWNSGGRVVTEDRRVEVAPGDAVTVDFTRQPPAERVIAPASPDR